MDFERRILALLEGLEVRAEGDGEQPVISGYAARFNSLSADLGGFVEAIHPDAFKRTLRGRPDVVATFNHDVNMPLGRTSNKRLKLTTDEDGLYMEVRPTDTQYARDLLTNIREGNVRGQSFTFKVNKDSWGKGSDGLAVRTLLDVDLFELGPVLNPAYPATDVAARAAVLARGLSELQAIETDGHDECADGCRLSVARLRLELMQRVF